jgi:hypothetical protein
VRVDEAGEYRDVAEIDFARAVGEDPPPGRTERDDAAAIDGEPSVADWRLDDRQNPGRVVTNQGVRASLPARLRAG